jgi:adenosylhomocysteine/aminodeoxyfutalosine nucleosidase
MKKPTDGIVAVLGAMDGEIKEFLAHMELQGTEDWNGFRFHRGLLCGVDVVVARCGVGKSLSAMVAQRLIDTYPVRAMICTGIAGAVNQELEIGDTVVARDCVHHDMDATPTGFLRGEIPFTGIRFIETDPVLRQTAAAVVPSAGRTYLGRILTGDQFIHRSNHRRYRYLREELHGDAVEMEGASLALVATVNAVPFLLIRTISDKADSKASVDFETFLGVAACRSWEYLRAVLKEVTWH